MFLLLQNPILQHAEKSFAITGRLGRKSGLLSTYEAVLRTSLQQNPAIP